MALSTNAKLMAAHALEDLGFAVAAGWLEFNEALDAYVKLRSMTLKEHNTLLKKGEAFAVQIADAVGRADAGEPPRINNKLAGIKS